MTSHLWGDCSVAAITPIKRWALLNPGLIRFGPDVSETLTLLEKANVDRVSILLPLEFIPSSSNANLCKGIIFEARDSQSDQNRA